MKKILLFSFLFIIIPFIIIYILIIDKSSNNFKFSKNQIVRVYRTKYNRIDRIPIEQYIEGVVSGEMPISFSDEALKAQAVVSRSYIMYQILHNKNKKFDVYDSTKSQVYLDDNQRKKNWGKKYNTYKKKIHKIVELTNGLYVTYNGNVADTLFFSTSSGYTENSEEVFSSKLPYLKSVKSDWDKISPVFHEQNEYSIDDFCKMLHISTTSKPVIKVLSKTKAGRINKISINNKEFTGKNIVKVFGLRSANFTITINNNVIITTNGFGHGVGMSQYGAEGMARNGYKYNEIIKYYYKGVKIEKLK